MEEKDEQRILENTLKLTESTQKIRSKLEHQSTVISQIELKAEIESNRFNENKALFVTSVEKLKNDGRNIIIALLILVIFMLLRTIRMN